jgi:hypothetical protein
MNPGTWHKDIRLSIFDEKKWEASQQRVRLDKDKRAKNNDSFSADKH